MVRFDELQSRLGEALGAHSPGSTTPHVVVTLPSLGLSQSLRTHYAQRIPSLEHRYLVDQLLLPRVASCEQVFVTCEDPAPEVLDYYAGLVPAERREEMRRRFRTLVVPDRSVRSLAAKLLERPDLVDQLRASLRDRPAFIEPWNVTDVEVELACRLGIPVNGTSPELWPLGFKSAGRKLFAEAGVPVPVGREDVRSVDDVVAAVSEIRRRRPTARAAVVKTDDSGAGDGNQLVFFDRAATPDAVRRTVAAFPEWYLADLARGGVVEELVTGQDFRSPSVQLDLPPDGEPVVLSTHEQVLGGPNCQVYLGCRFPADPDYAWRLAGYGLAVGKVLARRGAVGRVGVDFTAVRNAAGGWEVAALEINLRKGGTSHPYSVLRHLVAGRYDASTGLWVCDDGSRRCYEATDNLMDPRWVGRQPQDAIRAISDSGLQLDPATGTGVVLHMLSGLAVDGRLGLTAIGTSREHASALYAATADALRG